MSTMGWRCSLLLVVIMVLLATVVACGGEEATTASPTATATADFPLTLRDSAGRQVTIPQAPQRIVSLAPSHTEILFAIGAGPQVAAIDLFSDFPPEAQGLPKVDALNLNLESVVALEPDLVVTIFDKLVPEMEQLGLNVVVLAAPETVEGVWQQIRQWGDITGHRRQAEDLVAALRQQVDELLKRLKGVEQGPRVFYELDPTLFTVSPQSYVGDMLRLLKAQNVATGAGGPYPQLSLEVLVERDPEVILLADSGKYGGQTPETVRARPGWGNLTAVKEGRIYVIDPDLVSRPGPRIVEGLAMLARLLYPELFP